MLYIPRKLGMYSITEAHYQMSGEPVYPKWVSLSKTWKNSPTLKSSFSLWSTSGKETFVDMYPLDQGEDPIVIIKLYF